jgi:UDP-N-acetylglucosamine 3-dehydrogenase
VIYLKKTRIGVIGAGRWGKKHVDEYSKMENVDLKWVIDLRKENLEFCQKQYKIPYVSQDYNDVLSSDVDAVSVCTINETHFEICKNALETGIHVLVEKPMTINSKTAYDLVNIAKDNNKLLAVGHIFRFNNALIEIKKLIQNKFFGEIFYLRLQWTEHIHPDKPIDIIFDIMPHVYDIMNYLIGSWPTKITCFAKDFRIKNLEDTAYIICEFPDNILTHSEISWTLPEKTRHVDVIGRDKYAKIKCISQEVKLFEGKTEKKLDIVPNNTIETELKHFIETIEKESFLSNDGEIGARTVDLIECTKKSNKLKKTIIV